MQLTADPAYCCGGHCDGCTVNFTVRCRLQKYYRLLFLSSHYNTLLGLLSALQTGQKITTYAWKKKIPPDAANLVFELHTSLPADGHPDTNNVIDEDRSFAVRAVFQDGPQGVVQRAAAALCSAGDAAEQLAGKGSCTWGAFRALAGPLALNSSGAWCDACQNKQVMRVSGAHHGATAGSPGGGPGKAGAAALRRSRTGHGRRAANADASLRSGVMIFVWCLLSAVESGGHGCRFVCSLADGDAPAASAPRSKNHL